MPNPFLHRRAAAGLLAGLLAAIFISGAAAEPVQIEKDGIRLNGNLEIAQGQSLGEGLVLLVHGTLAHHRMEIMRDLQALLGERGLSSLAVTLSLGIDDRQGSFDCALPQRHRQSDAAPEIAAWLDWLAGRGAGPVLLAGHSRGGAQVADFVAGHSHPAIAGVVLIAPGTWSADTVAKGYEESFGKPLQPRLAEAEALAAAGGGGLMRTGFLLCPQAVVAAPTFLDYYRDGADKDTPAMLPRLPGPVLVIASDADRVIPDIPERVAPLADGERIRLVVIQGADHMFRDLFADEVADAMAEFADERL